MTLVPQQSPGFLLWHVTLRWQREVAAALGPLDLTHVQFVLLASTWWLNQQGEQPSQAALAGHAGTDVKMTSQVLRSLERKELVVREVDSADSRARRLAVTPAGSRLARRALEAVEGVDLAFVAPLSRTAQDGLLRALRTLSATPDQRLGSAVRQGRRQQDTMSVAFPLPWSPPPCVLPVPAPAPPRSSSRRSASRP